MPLILTLSPGLCAGHRVGKTEKIYIINIHRDGEQYQ